MVAGLTIGKKKYAAVEAEMKEIALQAAALGNRLASLVQKDADAFSAVSEAYKLPRETDDQQKRRHAAVKSALLGAAEIPLETARACVDVARLAHVCAERGNQNAVSDAGVASLMAGSGARGAAYNILINLKSLSENPASRRIRDELTELLDTMGTLQNKTSEIVNVSLK